VTNAHCSRLVALFDPRGSYAERWISLPHTLRFRSLDGMKSDPRFVAFVHKMGLEP
jgi:hypothetical protein